MPDQHDPSDSPNPSEPVDRFGVAEPAERETPAFPWFYAAIHAWCWLRIAIGLTGLGALAGVAALYAVGGAAGWACAGMLTAIGAWFGYRMAERARRRNQLVEFAHGLSPRKGSVHTAANKDRPGADRS